MGRRSARRREGAATVDPARSHDRFANTAARLEALSAGHPMDEWLRFMARLHGPSMSWPWPWDLSPSLDKSRWSRRCAHACRRFLRMGIAETRLGARLSQCCSIVSTTETCQRQHAAVMASLREREANAVEILAEGFLHRGVDAADAGAALYVAAALQVYFTHMAAALPEAFLRLLPTARTVPLLRLDARLRNGDCNGPDAGHALFILLALLDGLEPCAGRVHHLRSGTLGLVEGDRRRFGGGQGGDVRRVPHLRKDAVPGSRHEGGPIRRRPCDARARSSRRRGRLGSPRTQSIAAHRAGRLRLDHFRRRDRTMTLEAAAVLTTYWRKRVGVEPT